MRNLQSAEIIKTGESEKFFVFISGDCVLSPIPPWGIPSSWRLYPQYSTCIFGSA
jgi:hypothetical protein